MGGFPFKTQCAQFAKLGVFREIRSKKHPIAAIWKTDGSQNHAFRGIEMVEILKSTLSLPVKNSLKNPRPRGITRGISNQILKLQYIVGSNSVRTSAKIVLHAIQHTLKNILHVRQLDYLNTRLFNGIRIYSYSEFGSIRYYTPFVTVINFA